MAERRQPRIACYQRAWLTLLTEGRSVSVRAVHLSGRRMRIVLDERLTLGAPVSIETGDWLALGEVCSWRGEYSHYVAELELEQMLIGLRGILAWKKHWFNHVSRVPSFVVHVKQ